MMILRSIKVNAYSLGSGIDGGVYGEIFGCGDFRSYCPLRT